MIEPHNFFLCFLSFPLYLQFFFYDSETSKKSQLFLQNIVVAWFNSLMINFPTLSNHQSHSIFSYTQPNPPISTIHPSPYFIFYLPQKIINFIILLFSILSSSTLKQSIKHTKNEHIAHLLRECKEKHSKN